MSKVIFLAGHREWLICIFRQLKDLPNCKIITKSREELILLILKKLKVFICMKSMKFMAAAKVGGIHANFSYPADFLYEI